MKKVLLADDSHVFVNLAKNILEDNNYKVCAGVNKQIIYDLLAKEEFDIFLLDLKFPHSSIGMELLDYCLKNYVDMPVVMISGTANIDEAIAAIRKGAVDFIEKPFDRKKFLCKVKTFLEREDFFDVSSGQILTKIEKKVLKLILEGKANKETAYILKRDIRTVERHRSNIMHKFGVDNIVGLVKKAALINLDESE
ncbi:MAG: response regulator [Candidatus Stygibacter australis]|nr:response regulator [Candidatus Stygibacter australis]